MPVANPGPDYKEDMRQGANLFTESLVALDAHSGKLKWWYQLRPNDDHDWDTTVVSLFDSDGGNWSLQRASKGSCMSCRATTASSSSSSR